MALQVVLPSSQLVEPVRGLWREYWDSLGLPNEFQGFAIELHSLPGIYTPPRGRLLLALVEGAAAGTGALRPLSETACEAKRLYVRPAFRGTGVGRALVMRLLDEARAAGYRTIYGDTLPSMHAALRLYRAFGFTDSPPYSPEPTPGAIYLKLQL